MKLARQSARSVHEEDAGRGAVVIACVVTAWSCSLVVNVQQRREEDPAQIERLYAADDPQFLRAMGVLLGPPIVDGNRVADAASTATRSFRRCSRRSAARRRRSPSRPTSTGRATIGKEFADALAERARAGVKVHVLLDWVGSAEDGRGAARRDERRRRRRSASTTRCTGTTSARINNRTHRKLLVVDGAVGFTGGVGIADEWTGNAQDPEHWRDTHFRVEGPAVAQMQAAFHGQLDQDHRRGAARRRLLSRSLQPAARQRGAGVQQLARAAAARACS